MSKRQRPYTGRDWNLVRIIQGATKSGIHKDKKKELDKYVCRRQDADGWDAELPVTDGGLDTGGGQDVEGDKDGDSTSTPERSGHMDSPC